MALVTNNLAIGFDDAVAIEISAAKSPPTLPMTIDPGGAPRA
jgi:hypothetical protein